MRDSSNVFVLFIVAFVAVIAIVVMLVSPSVNYHLSNSVGFAFSSLYSGYAVPINGVIVDSNLNFVSSADTISRTIDVSDDIIYRRAYVSYDGSSWSQFNLTPTSTLSGEWIYGRGISNITFSPAILHLNTTRTSSNNTFIIVYSCSKNITIHNWSCHDGWQIVPFKASLNSASSNSGSKIVIYAAGRYGDGAYPTMELIIDNNVVASWIVDGDVDLPMFKSYFYTHTSVIDKNSVVRVNYLSESWGSIRDLRVDKIVIDNVTYESESPSNINTGIWDGVNCGGVPYPGNEWLVCSGYIQYNLSPVANPIFTCSDNKQNQGETGVDCGGPCLACVITCIDTCSSLGYPCGSQIICGKSVDCGLCSTNYLKTFYVSSSMGSATGDGSINNPWKTISQVNSQTFKAGDAILFKRGDSWYGSLIVSSSGSSSAPITYGAYGSGDKPIITGFTTISGWTNESSGIYSKVVPTQSPVNMVTVDGVNTGMGRYPDEGTWLTTTTVGTGYLTDNSLPASPNWMGAEIVMRTDWYLTNRGKIISQSTHQINYDRTGFAGTGNGYVGGGYFIQNDIRTLTTLGEWYYDDNTNKFYMYFGSVDPATKVVKVASLDTGVSSSQSYVTIDNINFQGFNGVGLNLGNSNHIAVTNCEVGFTGSDGAVMGVNNAYDNFYLHDTNAIAISGSQNGFTLTNSRVENAGMIYGTGYGYDGQGKVMDYWGDNALVQYNVFRNIGADCVMVTGNNIAIRNNLFDNCAAMTSDQGAIYMTGVEKTNRVISNNIILNTIGTWSGLPGSRTVWTTAEGIYFDEPCSGVTVSGNTVAGIANGCGIKLHETHDVIITNNTLYNNYQGLMCQGSGSQPNDPIRNVALSGNKIIALSAGQYMWVFWSAFDDISQFGTATGQWYARPVDDGVDQDFFVREPDVNNGYNQWLTYAQMIARTGETNSTFSSVTATSPNDIRFEYNAAKTNKVITLNGNYRDVKGTAYSGSVTLAPYTSVVLIKG